MVVLDDLEADPQATYAGVCRFLEIDDSFRPDDLGARKNVYHQWRPAWLWRFMIRNRVFDRMPQRFAQFLALRVMAPRVKPVPRIPAAVEARLAEFYAPENEALGSWLGRDLGAWKRGDG